MNEFVHPIFLTLLCGIFSAVINIPWGIFWGWVFARFEFKGKLFLQTVLYSPIVLPPVLMGYLLLLCLGREGFLGKWLWANLGLSFVLDWKGALLASAIVSGPFMVESMRQAFTNLDDRLVLVARGLGADSVKAFWTITFPLARGGLLAGFFMVFSRSVGEFGATIILAGNIPGKTQTIPLAIFNNIYTGHDSANFVLVVAALLLAYGGLALSHFYRRQYEHENRS